MKTSQLRMIIIVSVLLLAATNLYAEPWNWQYLPHIAAGGGWTSYLTIDDPHGVSSKTVWIYFYDDDGKPLSLSVDGTAQTYFYFTLSAYQERTFVITGSSSTRSGQVQIASQGIERLNASLRYAYLDGSGNIIDAVGVLPSVPNYSWSFAMDKQTSSDAMGIAIANPYTDVTPVVTFNLYQNGVRVPGTTSVTRSIASLGHLAIFVSQLFPGAVYSGTATLIASSTQSSFAAVALRADKSQYSSLSVNSDVQSWSVAITGESGTEKWAWRFNDGFTFIGSGTNSNNSDSAFKVRGVCATDLSPKYFLLEWNYEIDATSRGVMLYQGTMSTEGQVEVINGTWQQIDVSGTIVKSAAFKATRTS
jgi:hypothetical protein